MRTLIFVVLNLIFFIELAQAVDLNDVQIHGFVSQGYLKSNVNDYFFAKTEDGTFEFSEFGLTVSTQPVDGLRVGIQFLARDFGIFGDDEVKIDWALAEYRYRDEIGFQIGKLKLPMGLHNQSRDVELARTHILLPTSFYNEVTRESLLFLKGVNLLGYLPHGFEYQLMYGLSDLPPDGDYARYFQLANGIQLTGTEIDPTFIFHLKWGTPIAGLTLGGNYLYLPDFTLKTTYGDFANIWMEYVGFVEYTTDKIILTFEHALDEVEATSPEPSTSTTQSFYIKGGYRLNEWLDVGAYYSVIYRDKDDKEGKKYEAQGLPSEVGWLKQATFSTRFDVTNNLLIKLEVNRFDGLYYVKYDVENLESVGYLFAGKVTTFF